MEQGGTVTLPDGRKLGYLIVGEGKPVFYFHGIPGSRLDLHFQKGISSKGLQIIGVDRPGFGLSTFTSDRKVSNFATDISFLADHLGINRFALLGVSGGGHFVITCAALLKERVTRAVVISGASCPIDTAGMLRMNKWGFRLVPIPIIGEWLEKQSRDIFLKLTRDPDAFMASKQGKKMLKDLPEDQVRLFQNTELRYAFCRTLVETYRQGPNSIKALVQEVKLMKKGWEVDLSQIPTGLVYLWHGTADTNVPVSNAYKNAKDILGAHLEIFEGGGHTIIFDHTEKLVEILGSS